MNLNKTIPLRKSVKKFSSKKPNWRKIIEAVDSARYAPMAGNIFSLRFIIVSNKDKIEKLAKASEQEFVADVQYVVVVCSAPSRTLNAYEERGKNYLKQQAGAGIQNFLLKLEEFGLATCWIGHFVDAKVKKILNIPEEINVEAFFPIGYEKETAKTKQKRKIELDRILYFNEYGKNRMF